MDKKEIKIILGDIQGYGKFLIITLIFMTIEFCMTFFKKLLIDSFEYFKEIYNFLYYFFQNLDINTLFSTQVMLSSLILSFVAIIATTVNDRCLNISYKLIFFKPFIYKNNYITLSFKILLTIPIALIEFLFNLEMMQFITLTSTLYFLLHLLIITYIMISKKSLIYIRLFNTIKNNEYILNVCISKIKNWKISKKENAHNQYIIQELALLHLIAEKSKNNDIIIISKQCASELICGEETYLKDKNDLDKKIDNTKLFDNDTDKKFFKEWLEKILFSRLSVCRSKAKLSKRLGEIPRNRFKGSGCKPQ